MPPARSAHPRTRRTSRAMMAKPAARCGSANSVWKARNALVKRGRARRRHLRSRRRGAAATTGREAAAALSAASSVGPVEPLDRLGGGRPDHRPEAELERLGDAALGVGDVAQLAGQAELAEARTRSAVAVAKRLAAVRGGERDRDGEVGAGLVDPDPARDVDEHVGARRARCPPWRASTASTRLSRLRSIPVAIRRGGTISVGATSAWTSTSSGRVPSIAHSTHEPGAAVASPTNRAEGSVDLGQAARAHLEHAPPRWSRRSGS